MSSHQGAVQDVYYYNHCSDSINGAITSIVRFPVAIASHSPAEWLIDNLQNPVLVVPGSVKTLKLRWNRHHFANSIFKYIFLNENAWILIEISLNLFLRVQFTIFHHWFWCWLGTDQATNHYLNRWWLDYRRIYAPFGLNEWIRWGLRTTWPTFCGPYFKYIFMNEKVDILNRNSLKDLPGFIIDDQSALIQAMACQQGNIWIHVDKNSKHNGLPHWDWNKIAAIFQAIFSTDSKLIGFWIKFHWLFPKGSSWFR